MFAPFRGEGDADDKGSDDKGGSGGGEDDGTVVVHVDLLNILSVNSNMLFATFLKFLNSLAHSFNAARFTHLFGEIVATSANPVARNGLRMDGDLDTLLLCGGTEKEVQATQYSSLTEMPSQGPTEKS